MGNNLAHETPKTASRFLFIFHPGTKPSYQSVSQCTANWVSLWISQLAICLEENSETRRECRMGSHCTTASRTSSILIFELKPRWRETLTMIFDCFFHLGVLRDELRFMVNNLCVNPFHNRFTWYLPRPVMNKIADNKIKTIEVWCD